MISPGELQNFVFFVSRPIGCPKRTTRLKLRWAESHGEAGEAFWESVGGWNPSVVDGFHGKMRIYMIYCYNGYIIMG